MKIVTLEAQNVMVLEALRVDANGQPVIRVEGKNGTGKSTALGCISMALEGKAKIPGQPITKGKAKGQITLDLGELVVTRTFTQKGGNLTVREKDGSKVSSPQAILDKLTGRLAFDPLAFSRMDSKEQARTLKDLVGINFDQIDKDRAHAYEERTNINRSAKALKAEVDGIDRELASVYINIPDKQADVASLATELSDRRARNDERARLSSRTDSLLKELKEINARLDELGPDIEEVDDLVRAIDESKHHADLIRKRDRRDEKWAEHRSLSRRAEDLTETIEHLDASKSEALASAKFPIEGLSLESGEVYYRGLPFSQASLAEQIRVSVAIGIALNPELKVLLIRDGSSLDRDNLKTIARMAKDADAQVWIERVSNADDVQVVIEESELGG